MTTSASARPLTSRTAVIVLGEQDSGTAALAGFLDRPGPDERAADANAAGTHASYRIATLNDRLLSALKQSASGLRELPAEWPDSPAIAALLDEAAGLLRAGFADAPIVTMADPRLCRLLPFWRRALERVGARPVVVHAHRPPTEAAGTPGKDAGHGTGYGLLLWLRHVLDAEAGSRGLTRVFARHDTLLSDWQAETDRIARALNLDCPRPAADARPGIGAPAQKPEHPSDAVQAPMLTEVVTILDRWAQAGEDAADRDRLDRLREALNLLAPFCDEPAEETQRQKARADEAERKLSVMAVQLREMTRRQEAGMADRLKLTIALDDPTAMSRDIASLAEQVDAKLRTLAQEQQDLNKTRGQLAHRENELQAHFARREAEIFASASWRVTAPLRFLSRQIRR